MSHEQQINAAGVLGLGAYLPDQVVTNAMLSERLDTSDAWIVSRTGIAERRIAREDEPTSELAARAARRALVSAGMTQVDALILATTTPDHRCPATAPAVATLLGLGNIPAFDVAAVCSGFLYALSIASSFIRSNQYRTVLVVAAEKFSSLIDPRDRNTAVIFGDGAGAMILGRVAPGSDGEITVSILKSDGALRDLIMVRNGGSKYPFDPQDGQGEVGRFFAMQGKEVFAAAVTAMSSVVREALAQTGWHTQDVHWFVGHQANKRILGLLGKSLDIPDEKVCLHLDRVGNTAAASIPLALTAAAPQFRPGDRLVLTAFGGGATWGAVTMTWPDISTQDPH